MTSPDLISRSLSLLQGVPPIDAVCCCHYEFTSESMLLLLSTDSLNSVSKLSTWEERKRVSKRRREGKTGGKEEGKEGEGKREGKKTYIIIFPQTLFFISSMDCSLTLRSACSWPFWGMGGIVWCNGYTNNCVVSWPLSAVIVPYHCAVWPALTDWIPVHNSKSDGYPYQLCTVYAAFNETMNEPWFSPPPNFYSASGTSSEMREMSGIGWWDWNNNNLKWRYLSVLI